MSLSNEIPPEVRSIIADKNKRQEFYQIIGRGRGTINVGEKQFTIEPSFNGFARELGAKASMSPIGQSSK